jgi:hypothetical protein
MLTHRTSTRHDKEYMPIPVNEQVEVASLIGDVALSPEGKPPLHIHVVLGRRAAADAAARTQGRAHLLAIEHANARLAVQHRVGESQQAGELVARHGAAESIRPVAPEVQEVLVRAHAGKLQLSDPG